MILRRVIRHVRQQEWAAIAIDFVIVVGILIAFQITEWSETRHKRDREAFETGLANILNQIDYLSRFRLDLNNNKQLADIRDPRDELARRLAPEPDRAP